MGRAEARILLAPPVDLSIAISDPEAVINDHPIRSQVDRVVDVPLPTQYGPFRLTLFRSPTGLEHLSLTVGAVSEGGPVLVRLHSECLTGDVFGSARCDCGEQLDCSLRLLQRNGRGVLLYLRQEGRGIGLTNKLRAYALQDQGYDTVEANQHLGLGADLRNYREAAAMLEQLGVRQVRLLTNNPAKIAGLHESGIEVVERIPLNVAPNPFNRHYLETKQLKLGHLFSLDDPLQDTLADHPA